MKDKKSPFHIMVKPKGAICNLDCRYCYFLSKEIMYPDSRFHMDDLLLETFIKQYIESQNTREVVFSWQGGEPTLMGLDFFQQAIQFQQKYAKPGTRIQNALQTNGTLLNKEWCRFFKKYNFLVGISIDGPQEVHDRYRVDKGGAGSFSKVIHGWNLLKEFKVETNILCSVHASNQDSPLQIYRFFRDELNSQFIQFIPIVERYTHRNVTRTKRTLYTQSGDRITDRSLNAYKYGQFLMSIFDEWVKRDVGRVFVQIFDVALGAWMGQPGGLCIFAPTCGKALALEHNGDLFSCDHYVEPDYLLGSILTRNMKEMAFSEKQIRFGEAKQTTLPRYCRQCNVRFACHGGCPKNRIIRTPDGEPGLNYLCDGYKAFFNHISHPMQTMVKLLRQRRPPAEIMAKK